MVSFGNKYRTLFFPVDQHIISHFEFNPIRTIALQYLATAHRLILISAELWVLFSGRKISEVVMLLPAVNARPSAMRPCRALAIRYQRRPSGDPANPRRNASSFVEPISS